MKFGLKLTCFCLFMSGCSDVYQSHFESYDEAYSSSLFEKGWLPDWLPPETINIFEIHNLDTNVQAFSYESLRSENWPSICSDVDKAESPLIVAKSFPSSVHELPQLRKCDYFWGASFGDGVFYFWSNQYSQ